MRSYRIATPDVCGTATTREVTDAMIETTRGSNSRKAMRNAYRNGE